MAIATDQFTISVINDGAPGRQGVSVENTVREYRLSDSSTSLTGDTTLPAYQWNETKPQVPPGKYIWERYRNEFSDGTTKYTDAVCDVVTSGLVFDVDRNTNAITQKVWQTDITTKISEYDSSTAQSIRDDVSQLNIDLGGITTRVGTVESNLTTKADGSTVTTLQNDYSDFKQTMSGFKTTVESNYAQLTDLDNLKVSGENLYVIKDSVPGYLHSNNGTISGQSSTYKEYTSTYIPVTTGKTYIIQSWATPNATGNSWLAYQFFTDAASANKIGVRTAKYGSDSGSGVETTADGMEHLTYKVEAPSNAKYLRVSYRQFTDGYCMVEQATMASEYSMSYKDLENYTDGQVSSVRTIAEQAADHISWLIETNGKTSSSFTFKNHVMELVNANLIIKDPSGNSTVISGGNIQANSITTAMLATDAIKSSNYSASQDATSPYSVTGTYLDLTNGNFYMPNFGVNGSTGAAYFNGTVNANAGKFGTVSYNTDGTINPNYSSYFNIETVYDYDLQAHAALVGVGSPYIQNGNWQVSENAVATRKYESTGEQTGRVSYYKDTATNTYYDVGMKIPTDFSGYNANDGTPTRYAKAFYYGRKYTGNNPPSLDSDWTYFFMVDSDGNLYENGVKLTNKYASIDGVSGAYLPLTGGTITGNLVVEGTLTATASEATKLATSRTIITNLASTSAVSFNGTANISPGVTGTLGVSNGGTGQTSAINAANAFMNALTTGSSTPTDNDYYISQYVGGGTTTTTYHRRPMSALWSYVKGKIDSIYNITNTYRRLDNNDFDTINVTDLNAGNLIVTGAGRFTNGLYGDLIGNADTATTATTADKVGSNLVILLNSGTTEGTNKFTYNGSATKNVNITKSAIGLGNVDNTADANKTVKEAGKVTNTLKIQLNGGTTEGTNQFSYNGSAAKNINITKSSVGLGNVENTALSTWAGSANLTTTKVGTLAAAAAKGVDTSISAASSSANLPTSEAVAAFVEGKGYATSTEVTTFVEGKGYVTSSGVTSVRVQATSPVVSSVNTEQSSTLNTTISLANAYGDTKNPYGTKTKNYVLAGPSSGDAAAPTFRALVAADIPTLTPAKAGLGNVTNNKQVKGLSSGTTSGHLVSWGVDGYTVADSGIANGSVTTKITLAGSDYSASSNTITITQANLQSAVQSTGLVLMTSEERAKLESIQVSEGGTIDFSGVTASSPLTATVATNKTVNITHNTSGVSAGTYRSVTVNTYGHVTAGTNPTTLSGYGITDAKIASGVITLGSNTITPLTANSTLDATKLSGTASISTTGNASTATKFSSNRSITLAGDVVGTSSSNGESGWSLTTTVVDDSHNHTTETIVPLQAKTYTGVIAAANDEAKGQLYFIKVQPDTYGGQWSIHYKVTATIDGVSAANGNGYETSDVYLSGMRDTYSGYRTWNDITNTSYRPYYYHCFYRAKEAGINGGYGHAIGINLRYSYNPTTAANTRTVTFEIIELKGCTVTLLDSPLIYANWSGTGSTNYNTYNNFDATTQGNTMSGDRNDVNYYNRNHYGSRTAAANIYRYQLCLTKKDRSLLPINSVNNSVATNKTLTTEAFDPFGDILYWNSTTTYSAGANVGDGWYAQFLADIRYSFNIGGNNTTSTLVGRKPLYLVASPQADGTAILHSSPLAQELPTTEDGLIYIYLGQVYPDTYPYRLYLTILHPIYWYKNGAVSQYIQTSEKALQDGNGAVIASTYAKLSGAKFTGAVNTANNTWNTIGDDAYLGDINKAGHIGIKGKNGNTGLFFVTYNQDSNTTGGAITWDGTKFSISGTVDTSISGNAATATSATTASSSPILSYGSTLTSLEAIDSHGTATNLRVAKVNKITGHSGEGIENNDGIIMSLPWNSTWGHQLFFDDSGYSIAHRYNHSGTWEKWKLLLDSNNYTSYTVTKTGTGASGTWGINITGSSASCTGNAATATKATQDSDGNAINTTYMKKSGGAFTGAVTGTSFAASSYISVNSGNSGTAGGLALYGTNPTGYGIAMRQTSNGGKHGHVQGDWAIYNYMSGATNRGFVWKAANTNVASIDGLGNAAFNGEVAIGTTGTDIDGSCSLVMDRDMGCLNFVFN